MPKHWMKKAFENSHGQLKEKAKAAGKSTAEFAAAHAHSPGKVGAQARLALVGMGKDIPDKPKPKPVAEKRYGEKVKAEPEHYRKPTVKSVDTPAAPAEPVK